MRHANGSSAISDPVAEFVDRLRLVQTGETEMILGAIDGDVLVAVLGKRRHEFFEVSFTALFAHELGREVSMHAGTVPIERLLEGPKDRLAAPLDVEGVGLSET